jgi:excisionase family DNA binding protein
VTTTAPVQTPPLQQLLSVIEVARRTSLSRRTVERLLAQHHLPSLRIGRRRLVAEADVVRLLAKLHEGTR